MELLLDYDKNGNIVGMEILEASKRVENPEAVAYAVAVGDTRKPYI